MTTLGLALTKRGLLVAGGDGVLAARAACSPAAIAAVLERLADEHHQLVITDESLRSQPALGGATAFGVTVWIAPAELVAAIAVVSELRAPRRIATILARMPLVPRLAVELRRASPSANRQVSLF